jgi:hypothetical protein
VSFWALLSPPEGAQLAAVWRSRDTGTVRGGRPLSWSSASSAVRGPAGSFEAGALAFERFGKVDAGRARDGGSGLGLAIARELLPGLRREDS